MIQNNITRTIQTLTFEQVKKLTQKSKGKTEFKLSDYIEMI